MASFFSGLSPLGRGRLTSLIGCILICLDTPSMRLIELKHLEGTSFAFSFVLSFWRGLSLFSGTSAIFARSGTLRADLTALGPGGAALGTLLMVLSNLFFPLACAQTTAANVLVVLAFG